MKLSVIIPAFNEEETILKVLQRLNETKVDSIEYEFIVINDVKLVLNCRFVRILKV